MEYTAAPHRRPCITDPVTRNWHKLALIEQSAEQFNSHSQLVFPPPGFFSWRKCWQPLRGSDASFWRKISQQMSRNCCITLGVLAALIQGRKKRDRTLQEQQPSANPVWNYLEKIYGTLSVHNKT